MYSELKTWYDCIYFDIISHEWCISQEFFSLFIASVVYETRPSQNFLSTVLAYVTYCRCEDIEVETVLRASTGSSSAVSLLPESTLRETCRQTSGIVDPSRPPMAQLKLGPENRKTNCCFRGHASGLPQSALSVSTSVQVKRGRRGCSRVMVTLASDRGKTLLWS